VAIKAIGGLFVVLVVLFDFMGYYVKKNFIIRDLCINMNTHQNIKFCRMGNFTKYSHSKAMAVFYKLVKSNNPPIGFIATAAPIVAQVYRLSEVIDIESLFEVIDIESLFEVIDIEPFKQKQQEIDDLNLTLSTAATNIAEQAIHPTANQILEEIENDLAAIDPEEVE
jgi:hypothetical protein